MIALDLALTTFRARGGIEVPVPLIAAINGEGWSAEFARPADLPPLTFALPGEMGPDSAPKTIDVLRSGFDATGAATNHAGTRTITKRKRQAYPNNAQPESATVVLDDYVYATDTIAGVTNNSIEISPKPIAAWVMPSRLLVADAVHWEIVAFHRNFRLNRQVACVRVRANDGTTQTAWQVVSATAISTTIEDANPVEVYQGDLDVTALATGAFWLEAEVYPWIGAAASVLRSEDNWAVSTTPRTFTRRYFHKDVVRYAAPPLAYVASTGSDTTGVWSTTAATALATPFLTATAAHAAIMHTTRGKPATNGDATGCRIRIVDTVNVGSATAVSNPQGGAGVIVERAPGVARAAAVLTMASSYRQNMTCSIVGLEPHLTLTDLTLKRTGTTAAFYGESATIKGWQLVNLSLIDTTTGAVTPYTNSNGSLFGVAINPSGGTMNWLTEVNKEVRLLRGVTADLNSTSPVQWVMIGCALSRVYNAGMKNPLEGCIIYGNKFLAVSGTAYAIGISAATAGDTITGIAVVQNLIEVTGTGTNPSVRISADGASGSTVHSVVAHNTAAGFGGNGRQNVFYDESSGTNRRQHKLMRLVGNVWLQLNTKGDAFVGTSSPSEAPNRIGQFPYLHGVGCQGEWSQFCSADGAQVGSSFSQIYPGLGASLGASLTVRNDPLFVNYQATTSGPTAGAGGGDYRLQSGSAARGRVTARGLAFDLGGVARPVSGNDAAGAYA